LGLVFEGVLSLIFARLESRKSDLKAVILGRQPRGDPVSIGVSEVPIPRAGPGELLVEMKVCGLCGTDIEKMRGEYSATMPVLGHEAVGVVRELGEGTRGFAAGDRVFPHHHVPCRSCYHCARGDETLCPNYKDSNLDPGGFSEIIRVPRWNVEGGGVQKLPSELEFDLGSLVEPLACCIRALDRCRRGTDDSILIVGAGPVGIMHALLAGSEGRRVLLSDVVKSRLEIAENLGVGTVLNAENDDVPRVARDQTGGRGVDLAIVASGNPRAIVQALKSVRNGGRVCLFGIPVEGSALDYDLSKLYNSSVSLIPSYGAVEGDVAKAMKIVSARSGEFGRVITHRFPLRDFAKGVGAMVRGEGMKVVITSGGQA
jgi:L-iditol 2-dehydrogenase